MPRSCTSSALRCLQGGPCPWHFSCAPRSPLGLSPAASHCFWALFCTILVSMGLLLPARLLLHQRLLQPSRAHTLTCQWAQTWKCSWACIPALPKVAWRPRCSEKSMLGLDQVRSDNICLKTCLAVASPWGPEPPSPPLGLKPPQSEESLRPG